MKNVYFAMIISSTTKIPIRREKIPETKLMKMTLLTLSWTPDDPMNFCDHLFKIRNPKIPARKKNISKKNSRR